MSLLQDADWLIRQLRIEFIRTEDPVAERMISFAIPSAHYLTQTQKTPHRHHDSPSLEANANQPNIPPRAYSQPLEAADSAPKLSSDRISSLTALSGNQLSDSESLHSMQAVTLPHATQNGAPQTPPSVSVSQMNLAMEDEVDRPGIITYLIDPVPEQSLCYSPNITQFVLHSTNQDLKGRHSRPVHQVPASATTSAVTTNQQIAALAERKTGAAAAAVPPALPLPPARPSTAPAPSAVAGNRVPQLPQPLPPRRPVNLPQPPPIPNRPQFLNSTASSEALVMTSQQSIFTKSTQNLTATSSMSSTLSKKIKGSAAVAETNPFAKDFGFMGGRGEPHPIKLKFYFPFSTEPKKPVVIQIRRDATVEQAIGYSLFVYFQEKREPPIVDTKLWHCAAWNMRICEDDGVVDEDFPALERLRKIQKFSFDQFAICQAPVAQVNESVRQQQQQQQQVQGASLGQALRQQQQQQSSGKKSTGNVFIKVHLYSTLEVKQTTTVYLPTDMLLSDVLVFVCRKRKIDPNDYTLKMADTKTDVPLDKTLESLGVIELCLLKKERGPSAGDIFLRPPEETVGSPDSQTDNATKAYISEEFSAVYKKYTIWRKTNMMGRQERILAVDGDYIYILPSEQKNFFDNLKTISFHISSVLSCLQSKKSSPTFKISFQKDRETKVYEFDAVNPQEAAEICARVRFISQFNR